MLLPEAVTMPCQSRPRRSIDVVLGLGVEGADGVSIAVGLVGELRKEGEGKRFEFTITRNDWRGGVELNLTAVRVLPVEGGAGGSPRRLPPHRHEVGARQGSQTARLGPDGVIVKSTTRLP